MGKENNTYRVANASDVEAAFAISQWTIESGTMLAKTPEELLNLFQNGDSILVFDENGQVISHAAVTFKYPDGSIEIGCVITDKEKRKNGAATQAITQVLRLANEKYPNTTKFALANGKSAVLFERVGGVKMPTTDLCLEVWEPCKICPKKPVQQIGQVFVCCDTAYNLTNIGK